MIPELTLLFYFGFYGLFLLLGVGHLAEPYKLAGAYDVGPDAVETAFDAFRIENANILHTYMMVTRIEGAAWFGMACAALYTVFKPHQRRPVFVNFFITGLLAAFVHANHIGLVGEKPAWAIDHPFNMVLLCADSFAAVLAALSFFLSSDGPGATKAKAS